MHTLDNFLQKAIGDFETGWNMGGFGAIAEFHHVADDPEPQSEGNLGIFTSRGGLRLESLIGVQPIAWESLSKDPRRWNHGVSLCLAENQARMHQRSVLTEVGPDRSPLRQQDAGGVLFDMGLNQHQVDFCVRTADPDLLATLRGGLGRSLLSPQNPALTAILSLHPHRVAMTRLGRIEVYQKIGGAETGDKSPVGPHTHVLPELMRTGRTHSANMGIPTGWIPCCGIHPENPVIDRLGNDKALNLAAYDRFQVLLNSWGVSEYVKAKHFASQCLKSGQSPDAMTRADSRVKRSAWRNAIRQHRRIHGESPLADRWAKAFDRVDDTEHAEQSGHE